MRLLLCVLIAGLLTGCSARYKDTVNPSFPVTEADAQADERRMFADLKPVERPVLVIGGFRSPEMFVRSMTTKLVRTTSGDDADFVTVPTWFEGNIEDLALHAVEMVQQRWPSDSEHETVEVDVVGLSMGGLVARYAADRLADTHPGSRRLKINRLITIATPHRGALLAEGTPLIEDQAARDMYRKSLFLVKLDEAYTGDYEIAPYARLGDRVVGPINAAPPGRWPIWVSAPVVGDAHLTVNEDRRILVDIARRLRGEQPRGVEGEPIPQSELDKG